MQNLKYSLYDPVHKSLPVLTLKPCSCGLFLQLTTTFIPLLSYSSSHFLVLVDFPVPNFHTSDFCLEDKCQLRQEPQGTSDFRVRSQGPCRLGTGESGLVLG